MVQRYPPRLRRRKELTPDTFPMCPGGAALFYPLRACRDRHPDDNSSMLQLADEACGAATTPPYISVRLAPFSGASMKNFCPAWSATPPSLERQREVRLVRHDSSRSLNDRDCAGWRARNASDSAGVSQNSLRLTDARRFGERHAKLRTPLHSMQDAELCSAASKTAQGPRRGGDRRGHGAGFAFVHNIYATSVHALCCAIAGAAACGPLQ